MMFRCRRGRLGRLISYREVFGAGGGEVEAGDGAAGGEGAVGGDFYV